MVLCDARRSRPPGSRAHRATEASAGPSPGPPSSRTPADARASRNIRVPWVFLSLLRRAVSPTRSFTRNKEVRGGLAGRIRQQTLDQTRWPPNLVARGRQSLALCMTRTIVACAAAESWLGPQAERDMRCDVAWRRSAAAAQLPRAKTGFAEQRLELGGLRAPIGRRCVDLAAELGRGMPAPARIVKHTARQRDHVGLASGDDLLRLRGPRDQADCD